MLQTQLVELSSSKEDDYNQLSKRVSELESELDQASGVRECLHLPVYEWTQTLDFCLHRC